MEKRPARQQNGQRLYNIATLRDIALKLLAYCQSNNWAGYDPYDALNSRVYRALPFLDFKIARLVLTHGVKRCPINLRPLLLVPKTANPKGIALFLTSSLKLLKLGIVQDDEMPGLLADKLLDLRSPDKCHAYWGYNFDWQTRTYLVPKGSPNIICSTFAANALLDAFEHVHDPAYLDTAVSTADFILETLFWREGTSTACFNYTALERTKIHNANLLGAAFLCRVGQLTGERKLFEPALQVAYYSVGKQHQDGSWDYGESPSQRWIDNFHTGYNLVALKRIKEYVGISDFDTAIQQGLEFYKAHFFRGDGAPRYFYNATYPIDIHSVAQSIITLVNSRDSDESNLCLARSVMNWGLQNMWDARGFFYFQKLRFYTVRIPYMRWAQAWMVLALANLLEADCKCQVLFPPSR